MERAKAKIKKGVHSPRGFKVIERIMPVLVWTTITMPIWLSPFRPAVASYLILAYFLYFIYKAAKTTYFATISYKLLQQAERINWFGKLKKVKDHNSIKHVVLIVNYKESAAKLSRTIDKIVEQNYNHKNIYILLGMEEREGASAKTRSKEMNKKYAGKIGGIYTTYHVMQEGEVVGKASNAAYACRFISKEIEGKGWDSKNVIMSICDADSLLPDNYLAYVTYKFLRDNDRKYRFYAAPVLLYSNFWKLSLPIRMQAVLSSIARFAYLSQRDDLIQISTYSTNLWLLEQVDYWDTDIIPEDWHIWMQAFFTFGEKVRTIPVYLPIMRDGVLSTSLIKSFKTRYSQERRWAWGASDIPYAITRLFDTPHILLWAKLKRIMFVTEVHFMWPTSFFILTISSRIPAFLNPAFQRTALGFWLPKISSFILTLSSVLLLAAVYFDYKLRERVHIKTKLRNLPIMFIQWYFLPIISFVFSSLPALEAHTRMLLGKKLEYKVTEKV